MVMVGFVCCHDSGTARDSDLRLLDCCDCSARLRLTESAEAVITARARTGHKDTNIADGGRVGTRKSLAQLNPMALMFTIHATISTPSGQRSLDDGEVVPIINSMEHSETVIVARKARGTEVAIQKNANHVKNTLVLGLIRSYVEKAPTVSIHGDV